MAKGKKRGRKAPPPARRKPLDPGKTAAPRTSGDTLLKQQLAEARAQQAATAEILKVISASRADTQPVFEAIVRNTNRLIGAVFSILYSFDGKNLNVLADSHSDRKASALLRRLYPAPARRDRIVGRAVLSGREIHTSDIRVDARFPANRKTAHAKVSGYRAALVVPLLRNRKVIGAVAAGRLDARAFSRSEIRLLQTFADQAVIAIENVRLFNETKEGLEQQTAISEVLRVISSSPTDVLPVLEAVAARAARICDATDARIFLVEGETARHVAGFGDLPIKTEIVPLTRTSSGGRAVIDRRPVHIPDIWARSAAGFTFGREIARRAGWRTILAMPLVREDRGLGYIALRRRNVRPFSERQITLLQTFADQAAIAIENVRLFNETREALERQTATAEILKVIASSPSDVQPVFDAIVKSAQRLVGGFSAMVTRVVGDSLHIAAITSTGKSGDEAARRRYPAPISKLYGPSHAIRTRAPFYVADIETDTKIAADLRKFARARGYRSVAFVPMLRGDTAIGVVSVTRHEPGAFTPHQIGLLQTFADQAVIAIENVRLFNETRESLEKQTATADILQVLSGNPSDTRPVFDAIVRHAARLCDATYANVFRYDGERIHLAASQGGSPEALAALRDSYPKPPDRKRVIGRVVENGRPVRVEDTFADADYDQAFAGTLKLRRLLGVPLLRAGRPIGGITVGWAEPGPIHPRHEDLLKTFADQAVIAIENVRLFNETKEALEQQRATAEVLASISGSMTDTQPVFEKIVMSLRRLFGTRFTVLQLLRGDMVEMPAVDGHGIEKLRDLYPRPIDESTVGGRAMLTKQTVQFAPVIDNPATPPATVQFARDFGFNSVMFTPMIHDGKVIGAIGAAHSEAKPFDERQIALIKTFADQAVIAIQNARLFNETKEALERQTATAEILRVIASSPSDVQPVFDAIARSANRLIGGFTAAVTRIVDDMLHLAAFVTTDKSGDEALKSTFPRPLSHGIKGKAVRTGKPAYVSDYEIDTEIPSDLREVARTRGFRSMLSVPMIREGVVCGEISVSRREPGSFTDHQIELLKTFADQAVIAIENVRLFNETREALERQTATSEILRVISSSPTDLKPVFDAILENAMRLCEAHLGFLGLYDGERYEHVAQRGGNPEFTKWIARGAFVPDPRMAVARAMRERQPVHYPDIRDAPAYREGVEPVVKTADLGGARTLLAVPMLKDERAAGSIVIYRPEVRPFTQKQIDLVSTFASQAVIAIENVRLFKELEARNRDVTDALEQQTATAEILQVIGSSPTDTQPVFDAIVNSGVRLFPGAMITVARPDGGTVRAAAIAHEDTTMVAGWKERFTTPLSRDRLHATAILDAKLINIPDAEAEKDGPLGPGVRNFLLSGNRAVTIMPMLRGEGAIGAISVTRAVPGPLSDKQIAILRTFADQAVIAIENVRLFNETKEALERQTATSDVLAAISGAQTNVIPVFEAIARNAQRLCNAVVCNVLRLEGDMLHIAASHGFSAGQEKKLREKYPVRAGDASVLSGRVIVSKQIELIEDVREDPAYDRAHSDGVAGWRRMLGVPMLREDVPLGVIVVAWHDAGKTPEAEVDLLKTFAAQAAIAIENVRLFNETKEALERQTAIAEILKVIASSPSDVQPVFEAIASSAMRLIGGFSAAVMRLAGDMVHLAALTTTSDSGDDVLRRMFPQPLSDAPGNAVAAIRKRAPNVMVDTESERGIAPEVRALARARGFRSALGVPMMRGGEAIGAINVTRREPGSFSDHHVTMLKTFADQAVIAIENVRLFNETKEALERQTATAEILKAISSSTTDTEPVFDAIVGAGLRVFAGTGIGIALVVDDRVRVVAAGGKLSQMARKVDMPLNRESISGSAIVDRCVVNIRDTEAPDAPLYGRQNGRLLGFRAMAAAPMLRDGAAIGALAVALEQPGGLSDQHVELLKTFADQAVIAIENVRLFKELQSRTEALTKSVGQLTALGEVGQAISSTLELETVLQTIVSRAVQLTGLDGGSIYEYDERTQAFQLQAAQNMAAELLEEVRRNPIRKGDGAVGHTAVTLEAAQVPDILDDNYKSARKELLIRAGYRAILVVPLLREDHLLGALLVNRGKPGRFPSEAVELLKTFATQSAMAIQNARLFREIAEKGKQLEIASQHKSNFLASMSHELRTPLNAILGFNEMILGDVYGAVPGDMQPPLAQMQTSGKHLLRLINNVLDLAKIEAGRMELSLQDYSVHDTVESVRSTLRPLAAEKGLDLLATLPADLPLAFGDSGRIAQCLMNLAGNSLKFTKAGKVEISVEEKGGLLTYRVTDTGVGIPPDKIGGLFTEFKQTDATIASEYGGTGLGLSISRKFVEMHGGRIWVESELGKGSSFIFEVPLRATTP